MRGRKPKSTAAKERDGTFKKNPQRRNPNEPPVTRGIPAIPATIADNELAAATWQEVCRLLDEMGILSTSDLFLVESFCITRAEMVDMLEDRRERGVLVDDKRNSNSVDFHKHLDRITKLLAEMGLTPSARSRLQAVKVTEETSDPFSQFLKRRAEKAPSNN